MEAGVELVMEVEVDAEGLMAEDSLGRVVGWCRRRDKGSGCVMTQSVSQSNLRCSEASGTCRGVTPFQPAAPTVPPAGTPSRRRISIYGSWVEDVDVDFSDS